jgi:predicted nucleic acid-binding protein
MRAVDRMNQAPGEDMIYVFIDTNIWIRVLTQGRPGCEPERLEEFISLVDDGKLVLLLPDLVELELEKGRRNLADDMIKKLASVEKQIEESFKKTQL